MEHTYAPKEFVIDLDKGYEERWHELALAKKKEIAALIDYLAGASPYKYLFPVLLYLFRSSIGFTTRSSSTSEQRPSSES